MSRISLSQRCDSEILIEKYVSQKIAPCDKKEEKKSWNVVPKEEAGMTLFGDRGATARKQVELG